MGISKYNKTNELSLVQSPELSGAIITDGSLVGSTLLSVSSVEKIITNSYVSNNMARSVYSSGKYSPTTLGLPTYSAGAIANEDASVIIVADNNAAPLKSTDYGSTWSRINMPTGIAKFESMTYGNGIWLGTQYYTANVWRSTDNGDSWSQISGAGYSTYPAPRMTYFNGRFIIMPTQASSVFKYSSDGISWTEAAMPSTTNGWYIAASGTYLWAAEKNAARIMRSSDGINWTAYSSTYQLITNSSIIINSYIGFEDDTYVWFPTGTSNAIARFYKGNPANTSHILGVVDTTTFSAGLQFLKKIKDLNGKSVVLGFSDPYSLKIARFEVAAGIIRNTTINEFGSAFGAPSNVIAMPSSEYLKDWLGLVS